MDKEKLLLARVSDKIKEYKKKGEMTHTSFLDPVEQMECENILRDLPHELWGGYENAERKIAIIGNSCGESYWGQSPTNIFCPFGTDATNSEDFLPIEVVKISSNEALNHRSVLGSILGLGIAREKVGDIVINDNDAFVFVIDSVCELILNDLKYVGREKVKTEKVSFAEVIVPQKEEKEINTTVASLRLDAVISSTLGISREKSSNLIEGEKVNVNYKLVTSVKKQLAEGDLISVRGYGRIVLAEIKGESKSGRVKIRVKRI